MKKHGTHGARALSIGALVGMTLLGCATDAPAASGVTVRLVGDSASGRSYRLRDAQVSVVDAEGVSTLLFDTEDDPDRTRVTSDLEPGDYTLVLHEGWRLERLDEDGPVDVAGTLVSPNPLPFTITSLQVTQVRLEFQITGEDDPVGMGPGSIDVSIGIMEPDAGTASEPVLAALTVSEGTLSPAFDPAVTGYVVSLPLTVQALEVTPVAPVDVSIDVAGEPVESGESASPIDLGLGATTIDVTVTSVDGVSRTYAIVAEREAALAQTAYVKPSAIDLNDQFGFGLAMDGDTLVVSTPYEDGRYAGVDGNPNDNGRASAGAAYVFVRDEDGWVQQAYLKADDPDAGDFFGASVAIEGDTVVVGAPKDDSSTTDTGVVYVFRRTDGAWSQQAKLSPPVRQARSEVGGVVAISGEVIAASALGYDAPGAADAGAVYVFRQVDGVWGMEDLLTVTSAADDERFGAGIALRDDTLVVGAPGDDSGATEVDGDQSDNGKPDSGAVWVYHRAAEAWEPVAYLKAFNSDPEDRFGGAVAFDGHTIVVGAEGEDSAVTGVHPVDAAPDDDLLMGSGAVYTFVPEAVGWRAEAYVKPTVIDTYDNFGASVSVDGGVLAVGATGEDCSQVGLDANPEDNGPEASGAAYRFVVVAGQWLQERFIKAANPDMFDSFGTHVVLSAGRIAVSAPGEQSSTVEIDGNHADNSLDRAGAVYLFE